jgi:hypothetical protein
VKPTPPHQLDPTWIENYYRSLDLVWHARRVGEVWHLYRNGRCVLTTGQALGVVQDYINKEVTA